VIIEDFLNALISAASLAAPGARKAAFQVAALQYCNDNVVPNATSTAAGELGGLIFNVSVNVSTFGNLTLTAKLALAEYLAAPAQASLEVAEGNVDAAVRELSTDIAADSDVLRNRIVEVVNLIATDCAVFLNARGDLPQSIARAERWLPQAIAQIQNMQALQVDGPRTRGHAFGGGSSGPPSGRPQPRPIDEFQAYWTIRYLGRIPQNDFQETGWNRSENAVLNEAAQRIGAERANFTNEDASRNTSIYAPINRLLALLPGL